MLHIIMQKNLVKKKKAIDILKNFTEAYPDNKYYKKYKKELNK